MKNEKKGKSGAIKAGWEQLEEYVFGEGLRRYTKYVKSLPEGERKKESLK